MLKWKTEEKTRENDKPRVVLEKGLGGGGGNEQNISRIAGNPLSVSAIIAPLLKKKTQNCRENGVCCPNLKAKQQTQTKKRKINQKNRNKEHNNNQDTNNRETRRPQMQETWVWKGDAMELALKESNKLKKGRKKRKDRTETKKNRMFALKGLMNYKEKQPWFFQIERAEKTKKKKTKSKSRILSAKTTLLENHPFVNP